MFNTYMRSLFITHIRYQYVSHIKDTIYKQLQLKSTEYNFWKCMNIINSKTSPRNKHIDSFSEGHLQGFSSMTRFFFKIVIWMRGQRSNRNLLRVTYAYLLLVQMNICVVMVVPGRNLNTSSFPFIAILRQVLSGYGAKDFPAHLQSTAQDFEQFCSSSGWSLWRSQSYTFFQYWD